MIGDVRPALAEDVAAIAGAARPEDVAELWASSRSTPATCMGFGLRYGDQTWTGTLDDAPVCMFGSVPASMLGRIGVPWMVGTTGLRPMRAQKALLQASRPALDAMFTRYDALANVVDERNAAAQRWLRWLGFEVAAEPIHYGPDRRLFRGFVMRRN